ncbi:hypothetical protein [Paenibacillus rigui]|uniref:Uncharacterized protein n=1 Tax=Paenibacillus rigui TaxID=554312 RepID=A0A229USE6_9BACL|nr:hypothetical protein [Paenibacillus rigui]OXM85829.1 hypothetical protein CF651_11365 [Paenibacillus rigui]
MNMEEELNVIRDYILLPIVISIVNKNRMEIACSEYTLKALYAATASVLIHEMRKDLERVRLQLKELNISVIDTHQKKEGIYIHYPYLFDGRRGQFTISKDMAKLEIKSRLNHYIRKVFTSAPMQPERHA